MKTKIQRSELSGGKRPAKPSSSQGGVTGPFTIQRMTEEEPVAQSKSIQRTTEEEPA